MYIAYLKADYIFLMDHVPYMNEAIANVIKALREKSTYSQEQLAGFARTSRSQIAQLEAGTRGVTLGSLFWVADSFGIPFLEFVSMIMAERNRLLKLISANRLAGTAADCQQRIVSTRRRRCV